MYFLVKRCAVLYLFAGNGSFASAPYLDIHGEADISMRCVRSVPLIAAFSLTVIQAWSSSIPA